MKTGNHLRMTLFALTTLMVTAPTTQGLDVATLATAPGPVVFVCEHGSVKSLIAASLFDRTAGKRGLPFRAIARGVNPEAHVPRAIVAAMRRDGFEVESFRPRGLQKEDVVGAVEVIAIGVDLTTQADEAQVPIQSWNDVPPASVDYAAARAALQQHIDALLDELQKAGEAP